MYRHYSIAVADPSPAMTVTYSHAAVDTYADAVAAAHSMYRMTGRSVCVFSAYPDGLPETYYWYRIAKNGEFVNRNVCGEPKTGHIA